MTPVARGRRMAVATVLTLLAGALAACGPFSADSSRPARPVTVDVGLLDLPSGVNLGVVVTVSSRPGQGAEWVDAAEGAQVAAQRLRSSGVRVRLHAVDDQGTPEGGARAVEQLVEDHEVSGIVLATSGSHVYGAVDAAREASVPVVAPYDPSPGQRLEGTWLTGPSQAALDAALVGAMRARQLTRVALVAAGGEAPAGVGVAERVAHDPDAAGRTARRVARLARDGSIDVVLVAGPAQTQAEVVRLLQGARVDLPVLLSADALSPAFADALLERDGTLEGDLVTAGLATGDPAALEPGAEGSAVSAWLAGLRAAVTQGETTGLIDGEPFAEAAADAETRSHDSVLALVAAAARARSTDPVAVAGALGRLQLGAESGLAGPPLDFSEPAAVPGESVVPLQATTQDPGLRGGAASGAPRLSWFGVPTTQ